MTTIVAPPWEEQPTGSGLTEAQVLDIVLAHNTNTASHPDKLVDAPTDGKTYGRKSGAWSEITSGGSGTTTVLWANRPSASATPGGEIIVSDLGYQKMYSDGTNWRPVGGRLRLRSQRGLIATPVATLVNNGTFALPGGNVVIPAGLLTTDASVFAMFDCIITSTSGTAAAPSVNITLGTSATPASNNLLASNSITGLTSSNGVQMAAASCLKMSSTTSATSRTVAGCGESLSVLSSVGDANLQIRDITTLINTGSIMYAGVTMSGATANVTGKLVTFDVFVEM